MYTCWIHCCTCHIWPDLFVFARKIPKVCCLPSIRPFRHKHSFDQAQLGEVMLVFLDLYGFDWNTNHFKNHSNNIKQYKYKTCVFWKTHQNSTFDHQIQVHRAWWRFRQQQWWPQAHWLPFAEIYGPSMSHVRIERQHVPTGSNQNVNTWVLIRCHLDHGHVEIPFHLAIRSPPGVKSLVCNPTTGTTYFVPVELPQLVGLKSKRVLQKKQPSHVGNPSTL